jgi:hypothetical protein
MDRPLVSRMHLYRPEPSAHRIRKENPVEDEDCVDFTTDVHGVQHGTIKRACGDVDRTGRDFSTWAWWTGTGDSVRKTTVVVRRGPPRAEPSTSNYNPRGVSGSWAPSNADGGGRRREHCPLSKLNFEAITVWLERARSKY